MNLLRNKRAKIKVEIYSKQGCHLCEEAKAVLLKASRRFPLQIIEIDITKEKELFDQFREQIPVVFIDGRKAFKFKVNAGELAKKLQFALQSYQ